MWIKTDEISVSPHSPVRNLQSKGPAATAGGSDYCLSARIVRPSPNTRQSGNPYPSLHPRAKCVRGFFYFPVLTVHSELGGNKMTEAKSSKNQLTLRERVCWVELATSDSAAAKKFSLSSSAGPPQDTRWALIWFTQR